MRILILGSGGREHAFAWKLAQSPLCEKLFIAPGNAGTSACGTNLPFAVTDFEGIKKACLDHAIDLLLVGPEEPLVKGIRDFLSQEKGLEQLRIIGPGKDGAELEGSKAFAKAFMLRHGIPTAAYREFTAENYMDGVQYLQQHPIPIVLKADGLAAGKGVLICENHIEAIAEFELMIQQSKFGEAGKKVVVEEFLRGIEMSVFIVTDGSHYVILPEAKDYKRIGEGDTGPNTGGMGAVSPVPFASAALMKKVEERIIRPTVEGLRTDGIPYTGFVFFGLMIVGEEPYVIEYNCRMGDPETEVVLPRLKNDLAEILAAAGRGELGKIRIQQDERTVCTVVAVSGGYPGDYKKGFAISGLDTVDSTDSLLFHMGTAVKDGEVVTAGGRVLCISSFGRSVFDAVTISKAEMEKIDYTGITYRDDIGYEFE